MREPIRITMVLMFSGYITTVSSFAAPGRPCSTIEFTCANRRCIPASWKCDGQDDCLDGSDEEDFSCKTRSCSDNQFQCKDNCIPKQWECDGTNDCSDGSDEGSQCKQTCKTHQFTCADGQCIAKAWKCDGHSDCSDGSDEKDCAVPVTVADNKFLCKDGHIIPLPWKCDGGNDCPDNSDEEDCGDMKKNGLCSEDEFQCGNYCILNSWVCDGSVDCINGEDERNCKSVTCKKNQYQCTNGMCIEGHQRCNGFSDCLDSSDEDNCPTAVDTTKLKCNLTTHFACDEDLCIPRSKLCDSKHDCPDFQDESEAECGINECETNNGGCEHICINKKEGYECQCKDGYRIDGKYSCQDIDECEETPGICSQTCINTNGGFHCSCISGYQRDPKNYRNCKAAVGETFIIFSHDYDIRRIRLSDRDMSPIVSDLESATALDFMFNDNQILWSDKKLKKLFRAPFDHPDQREVILDNQEIESDGLAVDWIHRNIYYTDSKQKKIGMISWLGQHKKTLATDQIGQPRAIAVSPFKGYVFWSDWGSDPKIERSLLDGSERRSIVGSDHVTWPNGITLDHSNDHIYWVDARQNRIQMAKLDGSHVKIILFDQNILRLPYSISVFEDRVYWTDWSKYGLYSANKFNGNDVQNLTAGHLLDYPKVVRVFHQYRQPLGDNVCQNAGCNQLCVRTLNGVASCSCSDGFELSSDFKTCLPEGELPAIEPGRALPYVNLPEEPSIREEKEIFVDNEDGRVVIEEEGANNTVTVALVCVFTIVLLVVTGSVLIFAIWSRRPNDNISKYKMFRFNNAVYKKTTEDDTEGGGFTISQFPIFATPSAGDYEQPPPEYTERDDVPLTQH